MRKLAGNDIYSLSMREIFLSLLAADDRYGYELGQMYEGSFDGLMPALNAGQIYTTLSRLERDKLVESRPVPNDPRGKRTYAITDRGRQLLDEWISTTVIATDLKHDFFTKFVVLTSAGLAPADQMIQDQRVAYLLALKQLDELLLVRDRGRRSDLLIEGAILHVRADLAWLDLIESAVSKDATS